MEILGVRPTAAISGTVGVATDLALGAVGWLARRNNETRDVWTGPDRLHIETHGVHGPDGARVAQRVEETLASHPRVRWARVNAPACRVVVAVDDPPPLRRELVALVAQAEAPPATEAEEIAEEELHHPAEGPRHTKLLQLLTVDALALALAGVNKVAPWTPLPAELAGLVSAAGLHPRLRELAASRLHGKEQADSLLSMSARVTQALAAGGSGVVLDIAQRIGQWREVSASQAAWQRVEPELIHGPDDAQADPVASESGRPTSLPDGRVEQYQQRALATGAIAAAAATPLLGLRRAAAVGLASLPKATETGPAAFASQLGRVMARTGALVMDRAVLRRLSRLDTLLLDDAALRTNRGVLTDLVPLTEGDPAEIANQSFALFNPADPQAVQRDGEWSLGPVDELDLREHPDTRERHRLSGTGEVVLGLARGRELEAILAVEPETAPGLDGLIAAARHARLRIVLATDPDTKPTPTSFADELVSHRGLVETVRGIQDDGGGVMLVSGDRLALGAADCGLGVHVEGVPPPWGAHVIIGSDLATAALLVEAVAASRQVERDSIAFAQVAGGIGAVSAVADRHPRPAARSLSMVNAGATLAFIDGTWRARNLRARSSGTATTRPPWHLMPADAVLRQLATDPTQGLTNEEVQQRQGGGSQLPLGTSLGSAFWEELANPLTPVLAGGAALSAVLGSVVDAALIAGITGVSALTGATQRVRTDRALSDLLARSAIGATVRRAGVEQVITAEELVVGDVVRLRAGDVVPADCRLLEANGVEADESSLTGESLPVTKDPTPVVATELADRRSMVYEGTTLASGEAVAVVVATGMETEAGSSMATARRSAPHGGVQAHLSRLTRRSLPLALGSAGAVTVAGLLHGVSPRESLHSAVSLAVSSVPEGLPLLVNAAQLAAARRLADLGALVRNPGTVEALGRVDVLCFDKTGTLTEGRLTVREVHDGQSAQPVQSLEKTGREAVAAALRATPDVRQPEDLAHQTDRAVAECARQTNVRLSTNARGWRKQIALAFDPSRSFHATLGQAGRQSILSVKGAPEVVLARCSRRRLDGEESELTADDRAALDRIAEQLAGSGSRVLAVAERRTATPTGEETPHPLLTNGARGRENGESGWGNGEAVQDLVFLGFLALADPVRGSAAAAAAQIRAAGVQIVMITGDHPATADAIAATVHPDDGPIEAVTGAELDQLDDAELDRRLLEVKVIARCSPSQKVRIIEAYQRLGKVVAMTGDGANDAPAIRLADVGIALGSRGTPAAQAAADLVVSDDRLDTIIAALIEGRAMWSSVRHALGILLGGNLGEIAFTILGATLTGRSPLGPRQLLLVNLLTDLAPAVAIALRPPDPEDVTTLLEEGPDRSLGGALTREMTIRATATAAGASGAWLAARLTGRRRRASTVALAALVGAQLGQTLVAGGVDRNVLLASLGSAAVLAAVVQTPGVSGFFGCTPLGPIGWSIAAGGATAGTLLGATLLRSPALLNKPRSSATSSETEPAEEPSAATTGTEEVAADPAESTAEPATAPADM